MHEVFRDIDTVKVGMIDGLLRESGIPTVLKNWTGGSNITSIPIPSLYPTVYVLNDSQVNDAKELIKDFFEADSGMAEEWNCSKCGETVDGFLSECWSCQTPREGESGRSE
ncbi:DUF2007 domain-containing protein [Coraliomargarita parva]|uniref:putative signal transducing protein n=1 Tax=Coraliomargarita parva TaxID=3014050 RepID=UPI003CE597D4